MTITRRALVILGAAAALSACSTVMKTVAPEGATSAGALSTAVILDRINGTRKRYGAAPLTYNSTLERAARTHARLMASKGTMSHKLGGNLRERVTAAGYYGAVGEDLGEGQRTLEQVIEGWLNSQTHRDTLLSSRFVEFGLAAATTPSGKAYWAFIAGGPFENWR